MPRRKYIAIIRRKLGREKADGMTLGDGRVYIDPRQSGVDEMDTIIHELLHDVFPHLSEEAVAEAAGVISRSMWRDKWRRVME
jgi:hypothetical protein